MMTVRCEELNTVTDMVEYANVSMPESFSWTAANSTVK